MSARKPISLDDLNELVAARNMADAQARKAIGLDPVRLAAEERRRGRGGPPAKPRSRYASGGDPHRHRGGAGPRA